MTRSFIVLSSIVIASAVGATGCSVGPVPMSSHTIATSESSSTDVLWVRHGGDQLFRCSTENGKPLCREATQSE